MLMFNLTSSEITGNNIHNSNGASSADIRIFEGNSALDIELLFDELRAAQGVPNVPITVSQARGTHEAYATTAYLFQFRNADLSLRGEWADLGEMKKVE